MTDDAGFAPNPYGGILTLATCKPYIRKVAERGEWIAGFTSKTLNNDDVGKEKLVYLMQVKDYLCFNDYYREYPQKRNTPDNICGDNIYHLGINGEWICEDNKYHPKDDEYTFKNDMISKKVLIAEVFYYFNKESYLYIPDDCRPKVPKRTAKYGCITDDYKQLEKFLSYVRKNASQAKFVGKMD